MYDDKTKNKITNNCTQTDISETYMKDNMMDNQLRFQHVQRKRLEIRKVDFMAFSLEKRDTERPKGTWEEIMEKDLMLNNITKFWFVTNSIVLYDPCIQSHLTKKDHYYCFLNMDP